ncbi:hypothetical protein DFH09DRAFT_1220154, partial [Mycena vulgaris]
MKFARISRILSQNLLISSVVLLDLAISLMQPLRPRACHFLLKLFTLTFEGECSCLPMGGYLVSKNSDDFNSISTQLFHAIREREHICTSGKSLCIPYQRGKPIR